MSGPVIKYKTEADSVRIRHQTLKGIMLVVKDRKRPIPNPSSAPLPICHICGIGHTCKTYHLELDDGGCTLVSTGVYDGLCNLPDKAGFDIANIIHDPPTKTLVIPRAGDKIEAYSPGEVHHARTS